MFDELIGGQGDVAVILEHNSRTTQTYAVACRGLDDTEPDTLREVYLLACDERKLPSEVSTTLLSLSSRSPLAAAEPVALPLEPPQAQPSASPTLDGEQPAEVLLKAKKKYKPVALKVRPIVGELPK